MTDTPSHPPEARAPGPVPSPVPKPPTRGQITFIIRRFLKQGVTPQWVREIPLFHRLWRQYPSLPFWQLHELAFPLNTMAWFLTEQGVSHLQSTWLTFHWTPESAQVSVADSTVTDQIPVDNTVTPAYHPPTPARPRTTADFLRGTRS